ncbi:major paralogous domain-containing protein [Ekhidna lutea]|uniref:Major paralogous domain-containing protein n=1 Tax=Ekhidna lutea TaxID=447679 RepID=A0A239HH66_EKHLU|nr:fibrobacter succinogenes major paralogous domain-containing protein [Ekhidna lutea]SNS80485.1 major paralogous domain-containing protein [Ekhidna lutea]
MNRIHAASLLLLALLISCQPTNKKLVDVDGNQYEVIQLDGVEWMAENLKVTHDREGNEIQYFIPDGDSTNIVTYGLLYDFENACKVCPEGWRLPTNEEWETLFNFSGDTNASNYKDTNFWKEAQNTNSTQFSARPTGIGNNQEHPNNFGENTLFWSSSIEDEHFIWTYILEKGKNNVRKASQHPTYAFSVRCVKASD